MTSPSMLGLRHRLRRIGVVLTALVLLIALSWTTPLRTQQIDLGGALPGVAPVSRQHVELETTTATVRSGRPEWMELIFHVDAGLHINSHAPHDELLVPTTLEPQPGPGVRVLAQQYPAGIPLRLDIGSGEVLSTYQGEFRVRLQVDAPRGDSELKATLHYQACDARSCFPPKTLPVRVAVTAR